MSVTPQVYAKARAEIVALFGWNADSLSPDQTLRIDCAVALRLALDDLQGRVMRGDGESVDMAKMLTISEALARILPSTVLATPPAEAREDPRQVMWQIYQQMRLRGEIDLKVIPDEGPMQAKIAELEAELAALKAGAPGSAPALLDAPMVVEEISDLKFLSVESVPRGGSTAINPAECDLVPACERAECDAGPRVGPDDPKPRRPGPVIEGVAVRKPPAASAAPPSRPAAPPAYDYNTNRSWRDHVLPSGEITATPMSKGRWWGPV